MRIHVGNLSYDTTEQQLRAAFEAYGRVKSVQIIMDRYTGRSKGFGFVEMEDSNEGNAAIEGLNQQQIGGRTIRVEEARPRTGG
ncbi:MAG: RNA-binding protein [Planctomycetes bacterium]|nr:RNA-binding protein [Planctomycetota bacterium]